MRTAITAWMIVAWAGASPAWADEGEPPQDEAEQAAKREADAPSDETPAEEQPAGAKEAPGDADGLEADANAADKASASEEPAAKPDPALGAKAISEVKAVWAEATAHDGAPVDDTAEPEDEPEPGTVAATEASATSADDVEDAPSRGLVEGECLGSPVPVKRMGVRGSLWLHLADCKGVPFPAAAQALSALAQPLKPRAAPTSGEPAAPSAQGELPSINPELLLRLQRVAERYPGRTIEIVSGYRTRARAGSRHRTFDALDIRVEGVSNQELSELTRTFEKTGVGYYPNSTFVHVDVRDEAAYWVDESGPGEAAKYAPKQALPAESAEADHAETAAQGEPTSADDAAPATDAEAAKPAEEPGSDAASAPAAAAGSDDGDEEAPQLASIADRALVVMSRAFGGRAERKDTSLPQRD